MLPHTSVRASLLDMAVNADLEKLDEPTLKRIAMALEVGDLARSRVAIIGMIVAFRGMVALERASPTEGKGK